MELKIELSKRLKIKPREDENIGFGNIYTDHMFMMDYNLEKGWHNPRIIPYQDISLDPCAMVFHYGQTVFEGLKAYRTKDNKMILFRPEENFKRMNLSCDRLCIPRFNEEDVLKGLKELLKVDREWLPKRYDESIYIRPFIISTQANLGVCPSSKYYFIIVLSPSGAYYKDGLKPVDIFVETEYVRAVKGGMGMAKTGGNYAVSLASQTKAHDIGFAQTLWLDGIERKYIEEVGAMNIFFVLDDEVVTPEINGSILSGITRKSVIDILNRNDIKVTEKKISIDEISQAYDRGKLKEIFGTGTAAVISPVGLLKYNGKEMVINNKECGKVSKFLYETLTKIQHGEIQDYNDWNEFVE